MLGIERIRCGTEGEMNNLLKGLPLNREQEVFDTLLERPGVRLERIVSSGQATPPGEWYDQEWEEWVMLVQGEAELLLEQGHQRRVMKPGDCILLPAGCRHRVEWTAPDQPTVWLALHLGGANP